MKCLGALDSFIVRLFILEAGLLGLLGSTVGTVVGTGIRVLTYVRSIGWGGVARCWGTPALTLGSWEVPLWLSLLFAILMGGVLSVLAALYPAWRAAKMPPAAALRSEF